MRFGVVVAILLGLSSSAFADDDPVQATLDCKVGGTALSPEKANTIAGHVQCTLVLDGWSLEGLTADAWIDDGERQQATPIPGKTDDVDDQMRWDPFVRGEDFQACKDFTIHAQLLQGKDAVWSTDLPVKTKCKKAKKVSAKLSCTFAGADGTVYAWPGNGAKKKPRLDDTLACWVVGPKKGDGLTATIAGHSEPLWQDDDTRAWSSAQMLDPDTDFQTCDPFTVIASITNADGQVAWASKLAIAQKCE